MKKKNKLQLWAQACPLRSAIGHFPSALSRMKYVPIDVSTASKSLGHSTHGVTSTLTQSPSRRPLETRERIIELEKLNEEKTRWLATAAHDLRHPAGAILAYSELLMDEASVTLSGEHKAILESIHTSCEFMLHMLNDIAEVAISASARVPLALEYTDLRFLLEQCISLSRPMALSRETELVLKYSKPIPEIAVDPWKMQQVLTNLIGNAIKYCDNGARVEVGAVLEQCDVLIWVSDDGPGIPPEEIENIFTPFHKTRVRKFRAVPGIGLGLSICKHIVERDGGRIWVESSVGHGAAFYLTLPLYRAVEIA